MRSTGVAVHYKPITNLRRLLVSPKDKEDTLEKAGVVYEVKCKDCEARYIGETERPLKTRMQEHQKGDTRGGQHHERQAPTDIL